MMWQSSVNERNARYACVMSVHEVTYASVCSKSGRWAIHPSSNRISSLEERKEFVTMNTPELQRLKMAWLAARETGDTHAQLRLLQEYPGEQATLIDFIAGYYATEQIELAENATLLPLTQRACQSALERVLSA